MATGPTPVQVALFQGEEKVGDVAGNLERMKELLRRASEAGAQLVMFPELFLTGYRLSNSEVQSLAEERGGPSFQKLSAAVQESNVAVLYGYPEADSSSGSVLYYNSAQLIDKDGVSLANYRKLHLWTKDNSEGAFTPGDSFADVVECCGLKIGILICYDVIFPETMRTLALRGAEVVLVPTAVSTEYNISLRSGQIIPASAYMNSLHVAYVNFCGEGFGGHSVCCNPAGDVVVSAGCEETLLLAPVKKGLVCSWNVMADRRPELYRELVA